MKASLVFLSAALTFTSVLATAIPDQSKHYVYGETPHAIVYSNVRPNHDKRNLGGTTIRPGSRQRYSETSNGIVYVGTGAKVKRDETEEADEDV